MDLSDFDLILTMDEQLERDLPPEKTYTLKEYAGLKREKADPYLADLDTYIECRDEIKDSLNRIMDRILQNRH